MATFASIIQAIEQYRNILDDALKGRIPSHDPIDKVRGKLILDGLQFTTIMTGEYDVACPTTWRGIGEQFAEIISGKVFNAAALERVLIFLSRFVREKTIRLGLVSTPEQAILDFFSIGNTNLTPIEKTNADFINFQLPILILDERLKQGSSELAQSIARATTAESVATTAGEKIASLSGKIDDWIGRTDKWENNLQAYEQKLKNIRVAYNFAALSHGFQQMLTAKTRERTRLVILLVVFGVLLIAPLVIQFLPESWPTHIFRVTWDVSNWVRVLPVLGTEVVLLYFFRIVLMNFYAVKDQILQVEYRQAMCGFIEGYIDFVRGKESKDIDERLKKFESVVFSPVRNREKDVPRATDLLDMLGNAVRNVTRKGDK